MSPALRVLFIGGTGVISAACANAVAAAGHELHVVLRGTTDNRPLPGGTIVHQADVHAPGALARATHGERFDVVVDFIAFTPDDIVRAAEVFRGRIGQYVFVGTTASYRKPAATLPLTESSPLGNQWFPYARDKIACEDLLAQLARDERFPVTVVRPSFTYDQTTIPLENGWDVIRRMREGLPVVVPGDGSAVCTLTHADDFACMLLPLLGNPRAVGETYHLTSDEVLTWLQVYEAISQAADVNDFTPVFVPSTAIAAEHEQWGSHLLGDKTWPQWYDTRKIRTLAPATSTALPYWQGARDSVAWLDRHPEARQDDPTITVATDNLIARWWADSSACRR